MNPEDLSLAKNPKLCGSLAALARQTATQTDTAIVLVKGGKTVRVTAAELQAGEG